MPDVPPRSASQLLKLIAACVASTSEEKPWCTGDEDLQELVLSYLCASCEENSGMSGLVAGAFTHWVFLKMRVMTKDPMLTEPDKKITLSPYMLSLEQFQGATYLLQVLTKAIRWSTSSLPLLRNATFGILSIPPSPLLGWCFWEAADTLKP